MGQVMRLALALIALLLAIAGMNVRLRRAVVERLAEARANRGLPPNVKGQTVAWYGGVVILIFISLMYAYGAL